VGAKHLHRPEVGPQVSLGVLGVIHLGGGVRSASAVRDGVDGSCSTGVAMRHSAVVMNCL